MHMLKRPPAVVWGLLTLLKQVCASSMLLDNLLGRKDIERVTAQTRMLTAFEQLQTWQRAGMAAPGLHALCL